ncbi:MAG: glutathione S-transferase family protein [Cardiobacteriaceae bacterium]|nr:glutathione S-transferase family protein [Cardiobacteriaceae bacterium]
MKNLTLYTHPMSRGTTVLWMLKECEADHDLVLLPFGEKMKSAEYLAINPLGKVPALKHGELVLTETLAILTWLAEQYPEKGLIPPAASAERGEYYRWMCFALHLEYAAFDRFFARGDDSAEQRLAIGYGDFVTAFATLRERLQQRDYLIGDHFTALDLYYTVLLVQFTRYRAVLPADDPVFAPYIAHHSARPAFAETWAWAEQAAANLEP